MSTFTVTVKAGIKKETKARERQKNELPRPPSRIARQLALAYLVDRLIEKGKIKNYAEAARRLGVTSARMTQVVNLLHLPAPTQNDILLLGLAASEHQLRRTRF